MNIFWLDEDFKINATYYVDSHVRKIILECAQIMSTTCHYYGIDVKYKSTHKNHPLCKWARESECNYLAIKYIAECLNEEYKFRGKHNNDHASFRYIKTLPIPDFKHKECTPPPYCMPEYCKVGSLVESYRYYYIHEKNHLAIWTRRPKPSWWVD